MMLNGCDEDFSIVRGEMRLNVDWKDRVKKYAICGKG